MRFVFFFFQAEDGIRDVAVTGVQTCALPIYHVVSLVGLNFIQNANQTNAAIIFVNMKPWDERTSRRDQIDAVLGAVNGYLFGMRNARGFAFNLPEIIGLGTNAGLRSEEHTSELQSRLHLV